MPGDRLVGQASCLSLDDGQDARPSARCPNENSQKLMRWDRCKGGTDLHPVVDKELRSKERRKRCTTLACGNERILVIPDNGLT